MENTKYIFYVYCLRRLDKQDPLESEKFQPFYVGKGRKDRIKEHRREAVCKTKENYRSIKIKIIHKLWKNGFDFIEEKIMVDLSESVALRLERIFIKDYGRIDLGTGCLANLTEGGEGPTGHIHSEEAKRKIGEASKGNTNTKGMKWTEEQRQNLSKIMKGHTGWCKGLVKTQETKDKQSKALKGHIVSEETKRKISETRLRKGIKTSPETKAKLSVITKKQWETTPEMFPQYFGSACSEETKQKIRDTIQHNKSKKIVCQS